MCLPQACKLRLVVERFSDSRDSERGGEGESIRARGSELATPFRESIGVEQVVFLSARVEDILSGVLTVAKLSEANRAEASNRRAA
jgi:hypothetical protein